LLRKHSEVFRALCAVADLCIVAGAFAAAFAMRFATTWFPSPPGPHDVGTYFLVGVSALPLYHVLLRSRGMYEPRRGQAIREEARVLLQVAALGTTALAAGTFFWRGGEISRLVLGIFAALVAVGLTSFRAALRLVLAHLRRRGFNSRSVLIVGTGALAREVHARFHDHPETGLTVVGFLGPARAAPGANLPPNLGPYEALADVVARWSVDQVVIALDRADAIDPIKLLDELRDSTAAVRIAPDLLGLHTVRAGIEDLDGLPIICLVESPTVGWDGFLKRSLDLVCSAAALVLLAPVLGAIALAVKRSSPDGPVLYRQRRMSLDGQVFTMLKFRTMIPDAEADSGPRWTDRDDPRRTRAGAVLRRLNLDELPQLWNVLLGEMSLVGPRPERPELIREFRKRFPGYMLRHKVKGGLTGLAQINGLRGNTSLERRLELDLEYAERWSLWLDLKIIVLTLVRSFRDPHAY